MTERARIAGLVFLAVCLSLSGCRAEEQMKALRAENMRLLADIENQRARLMAQDQALDNCKTAITGAGAIVTELQEKLQAAESEASKARRQVRGSEKLAAEAQLAAEDCRRQLIDVRREVETLQAALQALRGDLDGGADAGAEEVQEP